MSSYLDRLKQQAREQEARSREAGAELDRRSAAVDAACERIWRYLAELGPQLEVLKPMQPGPYRLDKQLVLRQLQCQEPVADVRKRRLVLGPLQEREGVDHLILRATLRPVPPAGTAVLEKDFPTEMERLEERLAQAGIACLGETVRDPASGHFRLSRYSFVPEVTASVRVEPEHAAGRIAVEVRNLGGLGTERGVFLPEQLDGPRLDHLARWWMGEPQRFFTGAAERSFREPL